jgi:PPOX class probable F420-dependent enzyme
VARHLREDPVVWLTTVTPGGAPSPNPVWFLWDERSAILVFTAHNTARMRHLQTNEKVSLNFPGNGTGGDIVVISGIAKAYPAGPAADDVPAYLAKYADRIGRIWRTPRSFSESHSVPIWITLTRLRGLAPLVPAGAEAGA